MLSSTHRTHFRLHSTPVNIISSLADVEIGPEEAGPLVWGRVSIPAQVYAQSLAVESKPPLCTPLIGYDVAIHTVILHFENEKELQFRDVKKPA